jgi:hypothetical protein
MGAGTTVLADALRIINNQIKLPTWVDQGVSWCVRENFWL